MWKIIYTNPYELREEVDKINQLFQAGLAMLHVRKPQYSKKQLKNFLLQIDKKYYDKIVIHSHYSLAVELGLRGIHISRKTRGSWIFMKCILRYYRSQHPELQVTTTFTDLKDLMKNEEDFSYVMLGPVFNQNYTGNCLYGFHQPDLVKYLRKSKRTVFALGGVSIDRIPFVKQLGFDGCVLQSAIWKSTSPIETFMELGSARDFEIAI